jgi:hypothetical protein
MFMSNIYTRVGLRAAELVTLAPFFNEIFSEDTNYPLAFGSIAVSSVFRVINNDMVRREGWDEGHTAGVQDMHHRSSAGEQSPTTPTN